MSAAQHAPSETYLPACILVKINIRVETCFSFTTRKGALRPLFVFTTLSSQKAWDLFLIFSQKSYNLVLLKVGQLRGQNVSQ